MHNITSWANLAREQILAKSACVLFVMYYHTVEMDECIIMSKMVECM